MVQNFIRKAYLKLFGLPSLLSREFKDGWKILDVGCGRSSPLKEIKKSLYSVGLDFYEPYVYKSKKLSIHSDYVFGDARKLPFKSKSFDYAVAIEVLEHLTKPDGLKMIEEMERVVRRKIILTTPNGFLHAYAGPDDNPDECHISGWTVDELKELSFRVNGLSGIKWLWKLESGRAVVRLKPRRLFGLLPTVTNSFVFRLPTLAFHLFCVKDVFDVM